MGVCIGTLINIRRYSEVDRKRLEEWAKPIIESLAFTRLANITFLGILSPRFSYLPGFPFRLHSSVGPDGTRADHSLRVAILLQQMMSMTKLPDNVQRQGIAWALLHDIATWPLSHTGEPAFSTITSTNPRRLRRMIIKGAAGIPGYLSLSRELEEMGVDKLSLLELYDKRKMPADGATRMLWKLIHSPVTPDTLEGMYRSGRAYNVDVPDPGDVIESLDTNLFADAFVSRSKSSSVLRFWRAKSKIYSSYINSKAAIRFESMWVDRIERHFKGIDLIESLLMPENCIVNAVAHESLKKNKRVSTKRYKPPLDYFVASPFRRKKLLSEDYNLDDLPSVLAKRRKEGA